MRQAVQSGVQALFTVADTNQDGQLSPYELNAAVGEVAKSAVQTVFQAADADRNGQLSMDEYDKALAEPAHVLFRVIDADNNNQISLAELERAEQILMDQILRLRVPEPPNSLSNQVAEWRQRPYAAGLPGRRPGRPAPGTVPAPCDSPSLSGRGCATTGWSLPAGNDHDGHPLFLDANRVEGGGCCFLPRKHHNLRAGKACDDGTHTECARLGNQSDPRLGRLTEICLALPEAQQQPLVTTLLLRSQEEIRILPEQPSRRWHHLGLFPDRAR